jgi:very-short-patch-repair endonuclease
MHEAEIRSLSDHVSLDELLRRHSTSRGTTTLRHILATQHLGTDVTRSELEDVFLAFLADAALPRPSVNTVIEGIEVDVAWHTQRLIAELDGFVTHSTRRAFERDRQRDRMLQTAGWRVIRITWRQLHEDRPALGRELRALLT